MMHVELQLRRPSLWYSCLWKDYRQIKPIILAVALSLVGIQLVTLAIALTVNDMRLRQGLLEMLACLPCFAPVLLAIGCSGMLIGQERQSGTWGWSSSLPVSWRSALLSKLCITAVSTLSVTALLCITPLALVMTEKLVVFNPWQVVGYASLVISIIVLEVVIYFSLASLLIRETLTALVIAALGLTVGQMLLLGVSLTIGLNPDLLISTGLSREFSTGLASGLWTAGVLLVGSVWLVSAFRQRWMRDVSGLGWFSANASVAALPRATRFVYSGETPPSEWWMLVRHAVANSWPLRLAIFLLPLLFAVLEKGTLYAFAPFAIGLMGLTAFEGDQTQQRIRFLSDRGVSPFKLISSRLLVAGLWSILTLVVPLAVTFILPVNSQIDGELMIGNLLGASLCTFLLGALSAICFRKPLIAVGVGMVTAGAAIWSGSAVCLLLIFLAQGGRGEVQLYFEDTLWSYLWIVTLPASLVLGVAIFCLAKPWLVRLDDRLPWHYVWICFVAWAIPMLGIAIAIFGGFIVSTGGNLIIGS